MKTTENFKLKQPEAADFYNVADFNENAAVIDGELKKAAVHIADGSSHVTAAEKTQWNGQGTAATAALEVHKVDKTVHVTAAEKTQWNGQGTAATAALDAHKADQTAHVAATERVCSMTHGKSGTVHALTGLSGKTGLLSVKFKATAAYATGDRFTVDGTAYTAKFTNGKALSANQFTTGALVDCLLDTAGKVVNFKSGGVDVSAATARESDVLTGKTFFAGTDTARTGTLSTSSLVTAIGSPATSADTLSQLASKVTSGKSSLATAITGKGVSTASGATFAQMAANIGSIQQLKSYNGTFTFTGSGSITIPLSNCVAVGGVISGNYGGGPWQCGCCNGYGGTTMGGQSYYDQASLGYSASGSNTQIHASCGNGGTITCGFVAYGR